ncbi:unnamed protein product [Clonostachys rosea]|uniref:MARVEL domain-containing protein n=1 Tax=Bionectria ochroleuca TaxID=29856 RepID=A0ABY6UF58_BIOOC|nr:unnamed protein product [Clonostachys rosea]
MSLNIGPFGIMTVIHAVLALFLIIELGMSAWLVDKSISWYWSGSPMSFILFGCIWSFLVLLYVSLVPRFITRIHMPIVSVVLTSVTMIFWFAGSTAQAVRIGIPSCGKDGPCQATQAVVAFGYFLWAGFSSLVALEALALWKSRGPAAQPSAV